MSKHNGFYSNPTQVEWTCRALLSGRTIEHGDEIAEVRGHRLAAIVHRLKRDYGWPIDVSYIGAENRAAYKLRLGCDRSRLRFPRSAKHLAEGGAS